MRNLQDCIRSSSVLERRNRQTTKSYALQNVMKSIPRWKRLLPTSKSNKKLREEEKEEKALEILGE